MGNNIEGPSACLSDVEKRSARETDMVRRHLAKARRPQLVSNYQPFRRRSEQPYALEKMTAGTWRERDWVQTNWEATSVAQRTDNTASLIKTIITTMVRKGAGGQAGGHSVG